MRVLVSTTVIEVGVDVPNATVMIVEHAERFGLSQLHQLRGRVGRGAARSQCLLVTRGAGAGSDARERLATMVRTQDGFEIARADLRIRGPGEMLGTRQAGQPVFEVADLYRDEAILDEAREEAMRLAGGGSRTWPRPGTSPPGRRWPAGPRASRWRGSAGRAPRPSGAGIIARMPACALCENVQPAGEACDLCGHPFPVGERTPVPVEPLEGLEATMLPPASAEAERFPDLEATTQDPVQVVVEAMEGLQPTDAEGIPEDPMPGSGAGRDLPLLPEPGPPRGGLLRPLRDAPARPSPGGGAAPRPSRSGSAAIAPPR